MNTTGLTHIQIREQEIKLKFGLPACQAFYLMCLDEHSEKYINETRLTVMGIAKLFFAAYENACVIDDKDTQLTFGNFVEWVEDMVLDNPEELARVVEVFSYSKYTTKLAEAANVDQVIEDVKKKLSIGSSSSPLPSMSLDSPKSSTTSARTGSSSSAKRGTNVQKAKKRKPKK
jgi:hypothetical protein